MVYHKVADIGDIAVNPYSLPKSVKSIEEFIAKIGKCRPLSIGGDHTVTLPVLRALAKQHGKVREYRISEMLLFHTPP